MSIQWDQVSNSIFIFIVIQRFLFHPPTNIASYIQDDKNASMNNLLMTLSGYTNPLANPTTGKYLIYLRASSMNKGKPLLYSTYDFGVLRDEEMVEIDISSVVNGTTYTTAGIFNMKWLAQVNAFYQIILTIFVSLMLVIGAVVLDNDVSEVCPELQTSSRPLSID